MQNLLLKHELPVTGALCPHHIKVSVTIFLAEVDKQELEDGLGRKEHVLPYHGDAGVF